MWRASSSARAVPPAGAVEDFKERTMIETFAAPDALADEAAAAVTAALTEGLAARGSASLVCTGGRSPGGVYDRLARTALDWSRVRVTLSDERFVEVTSPDSNEKLVKERLLIGEAAAADYFGLRGMAATPEDAAAAAAGVLHDWPTFDVVLLGMGDDGHFASLFPGSPALDAGLASDAPACLAVPQGEGGQAPSMPRLSLSLTRLANARLVLILTSGDGKRRILDQALAGASPQQFPIGAVLKSAPSVRILWTA